MYYAEKTSGEIGQLAPKSIAVLPLAAVEQHGSHLPVVTDTAIADELARRVEKALPGLCLLLPTLWCGSSHHHKAFPGALSLNSNTYVHVLTDLIDCLVESGFRRIFLLNCHGGNQTPFAEALYRTNLKYRGPDAPWVAAASYWNLSGPELAAQTFMETPKLSHACEYETSLMMALRLDWIRGTPSAGSRSFSSRFYDPLNYEPSRVVVSQTFDDLSVDGALGSPAKASSEKGQKLFDVITPPIVAFLQEFAGWKRSPATEEQT